MLGEVHQRNEKQTEQKLSDVKGNGNNCSRVPGPFRMTFAATKMAQERTREQAILLTQFNRFNRVALIKPATL